MRLLVIKPSSLGDIVHAMVIISELRAQLPGCVIDWVVGDRFFDIVDQSRIASRVIIYERHGHLASIFRLISEIRRETYDYVFDMQGLARSGLMTFFSKSINKIGRKDARELAWLAYTKTVDYPGPVHAIDVLRAFLPAVGCSGKVSGLVGELENIHSQIFNTFLKTKIWPNDLVCIFPESQRPEKEWLFFSKIVEKLLQQTNGTAIVLLGNKPCAGEETRSPLLFDLRGKTTLADVVFLIKHARLTIANDSGPLHISAALGRNTLGLFTATDPLRFGPYPLTRHTNRALSLKNTPQELDIVTKTALEMLAGA
ncbi:MAG: glycosyltransferase family 9 protein [Puniceicoccales bacterium]|jgi:ADP-heptose:LPS heptosyltransferase|nr:glycosyltransferase family 9 protein [Puniceicoccales bacterium]